MFFRSTKMPLPPHKLQPVLKPPLNTQESLVILFKNSALQVFKWNVLLTIRSHIKPTGYHCIRVNTINAELFAIHLLVVIVCLDKPPGMHVSVSVL